MTTPTATAVPSSAPQDLLFNAEKLDEAVSSAALTYLDRFGVSHLTLAGAMARVSAVNPRGAWATATLYAARDIVSNSGTWYIALDAHTSGATFAGDQAAHWRVYQGVLGTDLLSATPTKGDALIGWNAVYTIIDGVLTGYTSLAGAVAGAGANVCEIVVRDSITMAATTTVPSNVMLRLVNRAVIDNAGFALNINGPFADPGYTQCFTGAGTVSFGVLSTPYVRPEWWGAKGDSNITGTTGTDSTAAIQKALNVPVIPVQFGYGNYQFSNLTQPSEKAVYGMGFHATNLVAKSGSTGTMYTDQGSGAKFTIRALAFYGNNCAYTAGFRVGYGGQAFGTEGMIDVWVRDLPAGFPGIDVNGNVGHFDRVLAQDTGGLQIVGVANMVNMAQSYGSKGFTVAGIQVATNLQLARVGALELEATASGVVPLYLSGNASIGYTTLAPIAGATYPNLIEIGPDCTTWDLGAVNYTFAAGTAPTITNGNIKQGTQYFGGNATGKNAGGEGNFASQTHGQVPQCFAVTLFNNAGTLQHKITDAGVTGASDSAQRVNGASPTFTNTPTGTDASTAFAAGVKIGSGATNKIWFDVPDQRIAKFQGSARIQFQSMTTPLTVTAGFESVNVNGVTRTRLYLQFNNVDATGSAFAPAASIPTGKVLQVLFDGNLS